MSTPAEYIKPVNDIEILQPLVVNHSANVSEMLIIDQDATPYFSSLKGGHQNPFHLTKYPRILSFFDIYNCQGIEYFDSVVDITCWFKGVDFKNQEVTIPIAGSGFLIAPPNILGDCWEFYFVTALHNYFPMEYVDKNNNSIKMLPHSIRATLKKRHRASNTLNSLPCEVVASSSLDQNLSEKENPDKDWILMKIVVPSPNDPNDLPSTYLIPSPSKVSEKQESDYDMCILAFPGIPTERDVKTLADKVNFETDIATLKTYFELDCKHISFGKFIEATDEKCLHYNASSFPGSSGGAILTCSEQFTPWKQFKQEVKVNRHVVGIHVGYEKTNNRCCHVKHWFDAFYNLVFEPMKNNFTKEEMAQIENERILLENHQSI